MGTIINGNSNEPMHTGNYTILPGTVYPPEYQEFMSPFGYWDLYGAFSGAFEADSMLTFEEVTTIIENRKTQEQKDQEEKLRKLEIKWAQELINYQDSIQPQFGDGMIDVTNIGQMHEMFAEMGGHGSLEEDIFELEDIIGHIDFEKLKHV